MSQSQHNDNGQYVRRVVLPSGRAIEVVYFEPLALEDAVAPPRQVDDLTLCPECDRDLVYPVEWEEVSPTDWEVLLRCPNCEWTEVGVFDQATVDRFDEKLDMGTDVLLDNLQEIVRTNMAEEIKRFVDALDADAIWPDDF
jgi:hypothetical protein